MADTSRTKKRPRALSCAVYDCGNIIGQKANLRFHAFPQDKELWQKWRDFCGENSDIDPESPSYICNEHFLKSDYERDLKFEMGFSKRSTAKLLTTAVPTVPTVRTLSAPPKEKIKKILDDPIYVEPMFVSDIKMEHVMLCDESDDVNVINEAEDISSHEVIEYQQKTFDLMRSIKRELKKMRRENSALRKTIKKQLLDYDRLEKTLKRSQFEQQNIEEQLNLMFTEGQIRKMKLGPKRRITWKNADVERALELYSTSSKAYGLLLKYNFPIPSVRTIQHWIQNSKSVEPTEIEYEELNGELNEELNEELKVELIEEGLTEEMQEEFIDELNDEPDIEVNNEVIIEMI